MPVRVRLVGLKESGYGRGGGRHGIQVYLTAKPMLINVANRVDNESWVLKWRVIKSSLFSRTMISTLLLTSPSSQFEQINAYLLKSTWLKAQVFPSMRIYILFLVMLLLRS
jgi:hypothetical protein